MELNPDPDISPTILKEEPEMSSTTTSSPVESSSLSLELGDIIEIKAPSNIEINELVGYICYINPSKVIVVDVANPERRYQLNINEHGYFTDESITAIHLLSRDDKKGYARQNGLLPTKWVNIHFGGDVPTVITGQITDLIEDMIEITMYPEIQNVIYIDFEYKGIPEHIPIEKIVIRKPPATVKSTTNLASLQGMQGEELEGQDEDAANMASLELTDTGEATIRIPENVVPDINIREELHDLYLDANSIVFEELGEITRFVEVAEGEQRYGIETQVNDMVDELLSTIPNSQRTKSVLDNIHRLIERFKQLRTEFSLFDDNKNVKEFKMVGAMHKPLIERIQKLNTRIQWLIPVVANRKYLHDAFGLKGEEGEEGKEEQEDFEEEVIHVSSMISYLTIFNIQDRSNRNTDYTSTAIDIDNAMAESEPSSVPEKWLTTQKVQSGLEAMICNFENFYTIVYSNGQVAKKQYVIQKYSLGTNKIVEYNTKMGKKMYRKNEMTPNDTINIKSFIMLPEPVMRSSKMYLPMTSIMDKTNYSMTPLYLFKLFRKNTSIISNVIEDLEHEFHYGDIREHEKDTENITFLKNIQEYILSEDLNRNEMDQEERFNKYLETVIPKTRTLLHLIRQHIKYRLSLTDVIQMLEPFYVYPSDITYRQYQTIVSIINEHILQLKKEYLESGKNMSIIRDKRHFEQYFLNTILKSVVEKNHLSDAFLKNYHLVQKNIETLHISPAELLNKLLVSDNGNLYTSVLSSILLALQTPSKLTNVLYADTNIEEMTDVEKILPEDCVRRYLTKRYTSMKDLQNDQNKEDTFYDKEFDDTPYEIFKKYKDKEKTMLPDVFLEFLKENLVQKHECPEHLAGEMAMTLITGKKRVKDGEYAILEIRPELPKSVDESSLSEKEKEEIQQKSDIRKKVRYYRRIKNNWVHDDSINDEAFLDSNTLFCNLGKDCYKNPNTAVCEKKEDSRDRISNITRNKMRDEFDKRVELSLSEIESELENKMNYFAKVLKKHMVLEEIREYRANHLAYQLGKQAGEMELVKSRNESLLNLILSQDDFPKKQIDLIRFVEMFCRSPNTKNSDESPHWLYCRETNVKLLPLFLFDLANAFSVGNYPDILAKIIHASGKISDDGDSIVDEHSGWVICKREYSTEEGFDATGMHITTNSIMEKDMSTVVMEKLTQKVDEPVFDNDTNAKIFSVFKILCEHMDIPKEDIKDFVLRTSLEVIKKAVMTEPTYLKHSKKQKEKTGKGLRSYQLYQDEMLIIIVGCSLLFAIQVAVPPFKPKKSFPGCVKSFSGYPLSGGVEDMSGMNYIACVIDKTKSSISVWNAIQKLSAASIVTRMKEIMDKFYITNVEWNELFVRKREYLLLQPENISIFEHSIGKWQHFLPPVVDYTIRNIHTITGEFEKEFKELIRKGHRDQHNQLNVLKSKAALFGFGIIHTINTLVNKQKLLLNTKSMVPFTENACCNDSLSFTNPIQYFANEDENIKVMILSARKIAILLEDVSILSKPSILYDPTDTAIRYPNVSTGYSEDNIYAAFIKYGNYDRGLPVPMEFRVVCEDRPDGYNPSLSLSDKILFLKKNGRQYTVDDLRNLLTIVNQKNLIDVEIPPPFQQADVLNDIVERFDRDDSSIVEKKLRDRISDLIAKFHSNKLHSKNPTVAEAAIHEINKELDTLKDDLYDLNTRLYNYIIRYFERFSKKTIRKQYDTILTFLESIYKMHKNYESDLYTNTRFLQNVIHHFSKLYPNIILNSSEFYHVPKHWKLSFKDNEKLKTILENHYLNLNNFKEDKTITRLLTEIQYKLKDINMFAQNIPVYQDASSHTVLLDKDGSFYLLIYCFFSVVYEYIECGNDDDLIHTDIEEMKSSKRATKERNRDVAQNFYAESQENVSEEVGEVEMDDYEVQINIGNKEELQERICMLLFAYLDIEHKNNLVIKFSYDDIMKKANRSKLKEKTSFVEYLGKMMKDERKVEIELKKNKLGIWNRGQQKGLFKYDKNTNERETEEMMKQYIQDMENGEVDELTQLLVDSYSVNVHQQQQEEEEEEDDNYKEDHTTDNFYDRGAYDLHLPSNFADGGYYTEDDEDDFGDD